MKITHDINDSLMITAAHRYCLGRSSYIGGACIEFLKEHWDQLDNKTQLIILKDTIKFLAEADFDRVAYPGNSEFVAEEWTKFLLAVKVKEEQIEWLKGSLLYLNLDVSRYFSSRVEEFDV